MEEVHAYLDEKAGIKKIEHKAEIGFDEFEKVEFLVGEVLTCKKHPNADRILVFEVNFGGEVRQICSGLAKEYKPEELIGRHVLAVLNLKPRKIRGVESNGMLLTAVYTKEDGSEDVELLSTTLPKGSVVC